MSYTLKQNIPYLLNERQGTVDDPYVQINDTLTVSSTGQAQLSELPVKTARSFLNIEDQNGQEVQKSNVVVMQVTDSNGDYLVRNTATDTALAANEYRVDYKNGIIQFNTALSATEINATYLGKGEAFISAHRIFDEQHYEENRITLTLQDYLDDIKTAQNQQVILSYRGQILGDANVSMITDEIANKNFGPGSYWVANTDLTLTIDEVHPNFIKIVSETGEEYTPTVGGQYSLLGGQHIIKTDKTPETDDYELTISNGQYMRTDASGVDYGTISQMEFNNNLKDGTQIVKKAEQDEHGNNINDFYTPIASHDDLAGAGRTTETVKANFDELERVKGAGQTSETIKANYDELERVKGAGQSSETIKQNADDIADIQGAGRTTETIKANYDELERVKGAGHSTETVKNNYDNTVVNAAEIVNIKGAGYTTETIKDNADEITTIKGVGHTTETIKENYDEIVKIQDGTTVVTKSSQDGLGNVIDTTYETKTAASVRQSTVDDNFNRITALEYNKVDNPGRAKDSHLLQGVDAANYARTDIATTFSSDVQVDGKLITVDLVSTNSLSTTDAIIVLNKPEDAAPVADIQSGLEIERVGDNQNLLLDSDGMWKLGKSSELQILATRDNITDQKLFKYDAAAKRLVEASSNDIRDALGDSRVANATHATQATEATNLGGLISKSTVATDSAQGFVIVNSDVALAMETKDIDGTVFTSVPSTAAIKQYVADQAQSSTAYMVEDMDTDGVTGTYTFSQVNYIPSGRYIVRLSGVELDGTGPQQDYTIQDDGGKARVVLNTVPEAGHNLYLEAMGEVTYTHANRASADINGNAIEEHYTMKSKIVELVNILQADTSLDAATQTALTNYLTNL